VSGASSPPQATESSPNGSLIDALPGLVRIAAAAWWRTAEWTVETYLRALSRAVRAAVSGESPTELFQETGAEVRDYVRRLLGIIEMDGRGPSPPSEPTAAAESTDGRGTTEWLRKQGEELLRRSADVDFEEDAHPAYARILEDLAPDEARILRLLAVQGAQPAVDVRTGGPLGVVKSDLVAPGLSMIGAESGCRHLDRVHAYLNNLNRLGLIWFSREPLEDPLRYQVLEAQPQVATAMREAGRGRTVRRSIHLTPFGEDFCGICLPLDTEELDALPRTDEPR
jgi:abortive infection alpha-like protein